MDAIEKACYPMCYNALYIEYPKRILVGKGFRFGASAGQMISMSQTPLSLVHPSDEVQAGKRPKRYDVIYTDTGDDSEWTMRLRLWAFSNYVALPDNVFWHLNILHNCQIEADEFVGSKFFQTGYYVRTDALLTSDPPSYDPNTRGTFISSGSGSGNVVGESQAIIRKYMSGDWDPANSNMPRTCYTFITRFRSTPRYVGRFRRCYVGDADPYS